jgi:hypothetical protein
MIRIAVYYSLVLIIQTDSVLALSSATTDLAASQRAIGQMRRNGHLPQLGTEYPKNATD